MSALDQHNVFQVISEDPLFLTATLWRGAMIERFAQIEFFIDRSLSECVRAKIIPASAAECTLPRQRCKALLAALESPPLLAKSHAASRSLSKVFDHWDERNALCHGRMKVGKVSGGIQWTARDATGALEQLIRLTPMDLLKKLSSLDRLKTSLGSQLGAIDKYCQGAL